MRARPASPAESVSSAEIREMDRVSIEEFGMPGIALMENAGAGAASIAADMSSLGPARACVLAGRGNNGGDAFVVARHLLNSGVSVDLFFAGELAAVDPRSDAGVNLGILTRMGIEVREVRSSAGSEAVSRALASAGLIVDGLLGTGAKGAVREPHAGLIELANQAGPPILALDLPSGLDADTGEVLGTCVQASITATFVFPKNGFFLKSGPRVCGEIRVVDIGMPKGAIERVLARRGG